MATGRLGEAVVKEFVVVYEWAGGNWSAYCPDVAGCVAVGDTLDEAKCSIHEAMTIWAEEMLASGLPIPEPMAVTETVRLTVPVPSHRNPHSNPIAVTG
jgi:predicted RNase H-like HicB family nuclease